MMYSMTQCTDYEVISEGLWFYGTCINVTYAHKKNMVFAVPMLQKSQTHQHHVLISHTRFH
jgi:hypothetical protein